MMTDKERLTNIIHNAQNKYLNLLKFESSILADYLLANGVIVPPYKAGDKVYTCEARRVKEWVITFCGKNSRGEYKMIAADDGFKNMLEFWDYDIGKTVFLTPEEAEKALERSKGNA